MDNTYVYKIKGMQQQQENAQEITVALESAGFEQAVVDQDAKELVVPSNYLSIIDLIKKVIDGSGKFTLEV